MQTIKPNRKTIFAKPVEAQRQTRSGILLTDSAMEILKHAEVINIGSDVKEYEPKDMIVFKDYTTTDTKLNGEDYVLVLEEDVLGKIVEVEGGENE